MDSAVSTARASLQIAVQASRKTGSAPSETEASVGLTATILAATQAKEVSWISTPLFVVSEVDFSIEDHETGFFFQQPILEKGSFQ